MILTPLHGVVFRATAPRYRDLRRTAEMSTLHLGRFNTNDIGAVYVSREPTTALEELRRRAMRDKATLASMHPRSIFALEIHLHAAVDLTVDDGLATWGLTPDDLVSDDFSRCQEMVAVAAQHGLEAVRWRSATGVGQSLALFVERLLPGSSIEIIEEFELTRFLLEELERGIVTLESVLPQLKQFHLLK